MSTPTKKGKKHLERDAPSKSSSSWEVAGSSKGITVANATANQLTASTRATLLGVREVKDPFEPETEEAIEEFHDYLVDTSPDEINLEECSLLLHSTAKLLSMQLRIETENINELVALVTNTTKEPGDETIVEGKKKRGRGKKAQEENPEEGEGNAVPSESQGPSTEEAAATNGESSSLENNQPASAINDTSQTTEVPLEQSGNAPEVPLEQSGNAPEVTSGDHQIANVEDGLAEDATLMNTEDIQPAEDVLALTGDNLEVPGNSSENPASNCDINTESSDAQIVSQSTSNPQEAIVPSDSAADQTANGSDQPNDSQGPVDTTAIVIPTTKSKQKREAKEKVEGAPVKKRRLNGVLPPVLLPNEYLDYNTCGESDSDDDVFAPILYPEVDLWNGQFDPSADPDAPVPVVTVAQQSGEDDALATDMESLELAPPDHDTLIEEAAAVIPQLPGEAVAGIPQLPGEELQTGSATVGDATANTMEVSANAATSISTADEVNDLSVANRTASLSSLDLNSLTSEDQQEIQNCINQLHYLPFTCELTKVELERTFECTVEVLEKIFKKYNMVFNRHLLNAATVVCANMVSSFSHRPSTSENSTYDDTATSFRESFSQDTNGIHSQTVITSLINSEKTIYERTREKSVAESRATVQKRLEEMQRLIVPKYIQWPLIAENTPEFFHRVKQFEQKMKRVLADEEKKETFDVSKYEIEVLAATTKESLDDESMEYEDVDDPHAASSVLSPLRGDDGHLPNGTRFPMNGITSPLSQHSQSSESGRKWVPLSSVFHHMKKYDRNECARHFYAVLALLSSKNLEMNYDRHYSQESAALCTKKMDQSQDSKYPVGLKIMQSRCPDADKEEIYVTALTAKSCQANFKDIVRIGDEMMRQDLDRAGKRNDRVTSNVSSVSNLSNGDVNTEDSDEEFVPMNYTGTFATNIFGRRRKPKN